MIQADASGALAASVLVLNRQYVAVHVVNVRRAFSLLCKELAEIIHLEEGQFANYDFNGWLEMCELWAEDKREHDDWIQSVRFQVQAPRVIRLYAYDRIPKHTLRFNRRNLFARDGHRCQYCNRAFPTSQLSLDHVLPRSRGGPTSWENVVCCCLSCNTRKGGRTPQEARMRLMTNPVRPRHSPLLAYKLSNPKYAAWRMFLPGATGSVDVA